MGAASYILAINLLVAGLFAGTFGWISRHRRVRAAALCLAATYLFGMAYYGIEALVPTFDDPRLVVFAAFTAFLLALGAFTVGLARRYGVAPPWRTLAVLALVSLPLNLAIYDMPRDSFLRVLLYQAPYAAMLLVAARVVLAGKPRHRLDWLLAGILVAGALHFCSKAFLAVAFGAGASPQAYVGSTYALISQATGAVLIVGLGLMMFAILVRDILSDATEKSATDPLTGLLNRRGFEEQAERAARRAALSGIPVSVVLADLDAFKAANDTYGHAGGDRVIAAFAGQLRRVSGPDAVVARIGGEEFAIVLPGANIAAARLFAEGVRSAFAGAPIAGLPEAARFTASFGIAEAQPSDALPQIIDRADAALYLAKENGRDRVRVALIETPAGTAISRNRSTG